MLTHIVNPTALIMFPKPQNLHRTERTTRNSDDISYFFCFMQPFRVLGLKLQPDIVENTDCRKDVPQDFFVFLDLQPCGPVHEGSSQFLLFVIHSSFLSPIIQPMALPGWGTALQYCLISSGLCACVMIYVSVGLCLSAAVGIALVKSPVHQQLASTHLINCLRSSYFS